MERGIFGAAGKRVVIEDKLIGQEISFFALCDGRNAMALGMAQDHKPVFDGDRGPNTGGMGAYSPVPQFDAALEERIMREVVEADARGDGGTRHAVSGRAVRWPDGRWRSSRRARIQRALWRSRMRSPDDAPGGRPGRDPAGRGARRAGRGPFPALAAKRGVGGACRRADIPAATRRDCRSPDWSGSTAASPATRRSDGRSSRSGSRCFTPAPHARWAPGQRRRPGVGCHRDGLYT